MGKPTWQPGWRCPGLSRMGWQGLGKAASPSSPPSGGSDGASATLRTSDPKASGELGSFAIRIDVTASTNQGKLYYLVSAAKPFGLP